MQRLRFKKIYFFFSSLFIFLLHLPFGFAKSKAAGVIKIQQVITPLSFGAADDAGISYRSSFAVYDSLRLHFMGLSRQAFNYAMQGFEYLVASGKIANDKIISIADFSLPSNKKRLFVIDLKKQKLLFNTYVAHGINSGKEFATQFSNMPESNKSSLGFYETTDTYMGKNGYSMHLQGLEKGFNDNAYKRDIVMHGAEYVHENYVQMQGYIGRSQGCPAVPEKLNKAIIDKIKNGTCFFIFNPAKNYLLHSRILKQAAAMAANNFN